MDLHTGRVRVLKMVRSGQSFDVIEREIDEMPGLGDEQKAALWLYGYTFIERGRQRYVARQTLAFMEGGRGTSPHSVMVD